MGRLSHIDDCEEQLEEHVGGAAEQGVRHLGEKQRAAVERETPRPQQALRQPRTAKSEAEAEMDFHGLSDTEKMGGGHLVLVVVAVVIVIAIALYAANYSLHFFG